MTYSTNPKLKNGVICRDGIFLPDGPLVSIVTSHHSSNCKSHKHDFEELLIVLSGSGMHKSDGYNCQVERGDIFIITEGIMHEFRDCKNLKVLNIEYDRKELISSSGDLKCCPGFYSLFSLDSSFNAKSRSIPNFKINDGQLSKILELTKEMEDELSFKRPGFKTVCQINFLRIITLLSRTYTPATKRNANWRIDMVLAYMENHFSEDISIEKLAEMSALSPRQFFRVFQSITGMPPLNYLLNLRIEKAASLLKSTTLPVGSIGALVGIIDSNYFSRVFKKVTGKAPSSVR